MHNLIINKSNQVQMLFLQDPFLERIIIVSIAQIWPIIYLSLFSYKLLKRSKNLITITLASFFLINAILYIFMLISIIIVNSPYSFDFYIIGFYLFIFSHGFLVIFSFLFMTLDKKINLLKYYLFIVIYAIVASYVYIMALFFNSIHYVIRPEFNWSFFIVTTIYALLLLFTPFILISKKLYGLFKGTAIEKRIIMFIVSVLIEFTIVITSTLYNTWIDNLIFRNLIFPLINPILGPVAAFLTYQSFGKAMQERKKLN